MLPNQTYMPFLKRPYKFIYVDYIWLLTFLILVIRITNLIHLANTAKSYVFLPHKILFLEHYQMYFFLKNTVSLNAKSLSFFYMYQICQ